jgi:hypothetical protein
LGISPKTLQRWQKLPEFDRALREARMTAFRQSMARLQQASYGQNIQMRWGIIL